MRMHRLGLGTLSLLALCVAHASATQPSACLTKTDDGGLKAGSGAVTMDKKEFYESSKTYPIQTFSDQAATGKTAEFCLRYEVENIGKDPVQKFYWGLAGIYVRDFLPGASERQSRSGTHISTTDPEVLPTTLNAFTNNEAKSKAWRIASQTAQAIGSEFADVTVVDRNQFLPADVRKVLAENNALQQYPLLVVDLRQGKPLRPLTETVSGPGFDMVVSSTVDTKDDEVEFQTFVSMKGESAGSARVSVPALAALEDTAWAGSSDNYRSYLGSVEKLSAEPSARFSNHRFSTSIARSALQQNSLFVSDHIITVQTNDNEYCYRVQSYLPVAVDFGLERCGR